MAELTPMMRQYRAVKEQNPDAIVMFRLGDFYEMFFEDAELASRELEITLTGRDAGLPERAPMCGVPYHAVDSYIARLVAKGYKVAICEQMEDPKTAKGVVRREVVRVVTPGTINDAQYLAADRNNFLAALSGNEREAGLALVDVTTGECMITQWSGKDATTSLTDELIRLNPAEILVAPDSPWPSLLTANLSSSWFFTKRPAENFGRKAAEKKVMQQFGVESLSALELNDCPRGVEAAGAAFAYIEETQKLQPGHLRLVPFKFHDAMLLDSFTRRNLELTETIREKSRQGSLLWVLDHTVTAMGGRLLRRLIEKPLVSVAKIEERQNAVAELVENTFLREEIRELLQNVYDMERLLGRAVYGNANGRDLLALKKSLSVLPAVKNRLQSCQAERLQFLGKEIDPLTDLCSMIDRAIVEDPPISVRDGGLIRDGFHGEVDRLRQAKSEGRNWLANLEASERERTGIKSLKVGFNRVFGYYIEVTKPNLSLVPADYERKQTLANAERFITPELKEKENLILGAEERLTALEYELFCEIRQEVTAAAKRIQKTAEVLAEIDSLTSLAVTAYQYGYVCPKVNEGRIIRIKGGRHPVVERVLPGGRYVPNDLTIGGDSLLHLITGPNMGGKSTYMRSMALIVLMAQMGSFVPAEEAVIGLVDRIFTRIGAADDLVGGQSTFLVEMKEAENILRYATPKSLVIMDELGRGTSTWDGLSIAQAVIEDLVCRVGCRCLFSTHYHELTDLEGLVPGVKNFVTAVKESRGDVVFLHQVVRGKADKSYGINVARMAGIPAPVINRAKELLWYFEQKNHTQAAKQLSITDMLAYDETAAARDLHPVLEKLKTLDINKLTPLAALNLLAEWQRELE